MPGPSLWIVYLDDDFPTREWTAFEGVRAFVLFVRDVLFTPSRFFRQLPKEDRGSALATGLIGVVTSILALALAHWVLEPLARAEAPAVPGRTFADLCSALGVLGPGLIVVVFTGGASYALACRIASGKRVFDTPMSIFAYSWTAVSFLHLIPFVGTPLAAIWAGVASYAGFRAALGLGRARAGVATILALALTVAIPAAIGGGIFGAVVWLRWVVRPLVG